MKCFVCNNEMEPYLIKKERDRRRHFIRCSSCGLVIDQTIYEMSDDEWKKLNNDLHQSYQGTDEVLLDPNWIHRLNMQADLFGDLINNDVISCDMKIVDYGCGDGKLAYYTQKRTQKNQIYKYDKYMNPDNDDSYLKDSDMIKNSFDVIVSCSVFEHLKGKGDIEPIVSLLKDDGLLCIHTLVCEEVPNDPDWFYLISAHCTFWTNGAMKIWFKEHNFVGCAYHVEAQMWLFFRRRAQYENLLSKKDLVRGTLVFSDEFVDYWKQKPYRK